MSTKKYVIRGVVFGYNDECYYVEGNRIQSTFTDQQEAEATYRALELSAARAFDISEAENIFEADSSLLQQLNQLVVDACGTSILEGDFVERGMQLPKEMDDETVLKFVEMAGMHSYQLLAFDVDKKFYALWLPEEKAYATIPSEGIESLVYAETRKELLPAVEELIEYNEWNPTIIRGKLSDISDKPLLLEQIIKRESKLNYNEKTKELKISGKKASTYMITNQFLAKPMFEVHELSIDEIGEIEAAIYKAFCGEFEDENDEEQEEAYLGPDLNEHSLVPLRKVCAEVLNNEKVEVKDYIQSLRAICFELVFLQNEHQSDFEVHRENADELSELYEKHPSYLEGDHLNPYFCEYYRRVIATIAENESLGLLIQTFDEAVYFNASLTPLFSLEPDEIEVFTEAIESQDDFDTWKDYLVLLATD